MFSRDWDVLAEWKGDYLSGTMPDYEEYYSRTVPFTRIVSTARDTPEDSVINLVDDLPYERLKDLLNAVKRELERREDYRSGCCYLGHVSKRVDSSEGFLVRELGLNREGEDFEKLIKTLERLITFNNQLTPWKRGAEVNAENYQEKSTTDRSALFVGLNLEANFQERLLKVFVEWEIESQQRWKLRDHRQIELQHEEKVFWNHDRLLLLWATKGWPMEIRKLVCKHLPVTLYGGRFFGKQSFSHLKWGSDCKARFLVLNSKKKTFDLTVRSETTNWNYGGLHGSKRTGDFEMTSNGGLLLHVNKSRKLSKIDYNQPIEETPIPEEEGITIHAEMKPDRRNGGIKVVLTLPNDTTMTTKYFSELKEQEYNDANANNEKCIGQRD